MTMSESSAEGVYFYAGPMLPAEGAYADVGKDAGGIYADIKDGREPALCGVVAVLLLAMLAGVVWLLLSLL